MAENRGGMRPGASQNNYGVSATGGAGNGGQPVRYMSGGEYGEGKANLELQSSAPMSKSGVDLPQGRGGAAPKIMGAIGQDVVPLNAPYDGNEPLTTGIDMGAGAGSEVLAAPMMLQAQNNQDIQNLAALLPVYAQIAESSTASNATRNFYRWLRTQV